MKSAGNLSKQLGRACVVAAAMLLVGCGGGGSDGTEIVGGIGGTGIKGPVSGATVTAYAIAGGMMGTPIASGKTDAQGNFDLAIGSYSGAVMLQLRDGTYTDESTGTVMSMANGDVMTAALPSVAAGDKVTGIQITPLTSMAQAMAQRAAGGMTDANIASANAAVGSYFMVSDNIMVSDDILHVTPMNPLSSGSGLSSSQESINYGMTLAAMSQYANSLGMSTSSAMVTAMMNDASDGTMDGMMPGGAVMMGGMVMGGMAMPTNAGSTGLASAMSTFIASSQNKSEVKLETMQALMNRLNASNGQFTGTSKPSETTSMVSGTVFNGTVQQATVTAFSVSNGATGAQLASTTTDAQGNFTMSMGSYSGPLMLHVSSATYVDEATGATMMMGSSDVMTAVMTSIASGTSVTGVMVTPLTSMAQMRAQTMSGGLIDANISAANASVGNYCMVGDILTTMPMNTLVAGSLTDATQVQKNYGACIAAMSQYAKSSGIPVSSSFVTDMMDDAADGTMNGMMGDTQISMGMGGGMMGGDMSQMMPSTAGTSGLANAMATFMSSDLNRSGATATDVAALMQELMSSTGQLP